MDKETAKEILKEAVEKELWNIVKEHLMEQRPCYLNGIDLSKVPVEKLREKYVDYKFHHFWGGVIPPFKKIAEDKEGKRVSEDAKVVADRLSLKYQLAPEWQIEIFDGENSIPVICAIADINENLTMVEKDMEIAGYFAGHRKVYYTAFSNNEDRKI